MKKELRLVADLGNGNSKIMYEGKTVVIPSYISDCRPSRTEGNVVLESGESFCFGLSARMSDGRIVASNKDFKVHETDRLLLGALANLDLREYSADLKIEVTLLSHAYYTHEKQLQERLTFNKAVTLAGRKYRINCKCRKVLPEAMGLYTKRVDNKPVAVLDFGAGTTQLAWASQDSTREASITQFGVRHLVARICKKARNDNAGLPLPYLDVSWALEQGRTKTVDDFDFSEIYKECIRAWLEEDLSEVIKEAKLTIDIADVWCIGGGVQLPLLGKALQKRGFKVAENPITASIEGLYQMLSKRGVV